MLDLDFWLKIILVQKMLVQKKIVRKMLVKILLFLIKIWFKDIFIKKRISVEKKFDYKKIGSIFFSSTFFLVVDIVVDVVVDVVVNIIVDLREHLVSQYC